MPDFDNQFGLDITEEERAIMHGYQALDVDQWDQRGVEFLDHIDDPIPQCKFCPEVIDYAPIKFDNSKKSWRMQSL